MHAQIRTALDSPRSLAAMTDGRRLCRSTGPATNGPVSIMVAKAGGGTLSRTPDANGCDLALLVPVHTLAFSSVQLRTESGVGAAITFSHAFLQEQH